MLTETLNIAQWILAGAAVLVLPGAAWLAWFAQPGGSFPARLADAVGLSIALTALAALLTFLFNVQITPLVLAGLTLLLTGLTAAGWLYRGSLRPGQAAWTALLLLAAAVAWRLYQARALALPAWVDAVHHVLVVQAFLQQGRLPADLSPLLPVPFFYHYGYHILAALYTAWSGLPVERASLVLGQMLNACVGLSVFRFGMALWDDTRRSAAAALLVTFAFHMPAYYLTWSRFPLLAGLVILPLAMAAAVEVSRQGRWRWEGFVRLAVLTGGLFLTHYLAALLFGIFLLVLGVKRLWNTRRERAFSLPGWEGLTAGVAAGVLTALPWVYRVWVYNASSFEVGAVLGADAPDQVYFSGYGSYLWYLAGPARNQVLLAVGLLGAFAALRNERGRLLAVWGLIIGLLALPYGIRLGPFRPDHMVIVAFFPAALLASDLVFTLSGWIAARFKPVPGWFFAALLVAAACAWGIRETRDVINPGTIIADQGDADAVAWVKGNTPADARFFINTTPWQGTLYRGTDGGWWILPLTGRQTVLPPIAYAWGSADYVQQITSYAQEASGITGCSQTFWDLVRADRLDYVYLHRGVGSLQPDKLSGCQGVEQVYQASGVWIYRLSPPAS